MPMHQKKPQGGGYNRGGGYGQTGFNNPMFGNERTTRNKDMNEEDRFCNFCREKGHARKRCPSLALQFTSAQCTELSISELCSYFSVDVNCIAYFNKTKPWGSTDLQLITDFETAQGLPQNWPHANQLFVALKAQHQQREELKTQVAAEIVSEGVKSSAAVVSSLPDQADARMADMLNNAITTHLRQFSKVVFDRIDAMPRAIKAEKSDPLGEIDVPIPRPQDVGLPTCRNCGVFGHSQRQCRHVYGASSAPCALQGCPDRSRHTAVLCTFSPVVPGHDALKPGEQRDIAFDYAVGHGQQRPSALCDNPPIANFDMHGQMVLPPIYGDAVEMLLKIVARVRYDFYVMYVKQVQPGCRAYYNPRFSGNELMEFLRTPNPWNTDVQDIWEVSPDHHLMSRACRAISLEMAMSKPQFKKHNALLTASLSQDEYEFVNGLHNATEEYKNPAYRYLKWTRARRVRQPQSQVHSNQSMSAKSEDIAQCMAVKGHLDQGQWWDPFSELLRVWDSLQELRCDYCNGRMHVSAQCPAKILLQAESMRCGLTQEYGFFKYAAFQRDHGSDPGRYQIKEDRLTKALQSAGKKWLYKDWKNQISVQLNRGRPTQSVIMPYQPVDSSRLSRLHKRHDTDSQTGFVLKAGAARSYSDVHFGRNAGRTDIEEQVAKTISNVGGLDQAPVDCLRASKNTSVAAAQYQAAWEHKSKLTTLDHEMPQQNAAATENAEMAINTHVLGRQ